QPNNPATTSTQPYPNYRDDRFAQERSVVTGNQPQQPVSQPSAPLLEPPATTGNNTQPTGQDRSLVELGNWADRNQNPSSTTSPNPGHVTGDLNRGFEAANPPANSSPPVSGSAWRDNTAS